MIRTTLICAVFAGAASLAGCAADGGLDLMTTGSIGNQATETAVAKAPAIDPACVELTAKIDQLRKEGTPERLAKVAEGKSKTANVKRDALARMAELDAANQEFQARCSTIGASSAQAAAAPAATTVEQVANAAQTAASAAQSAQTAAATAKQAAQAAQSTAQVVKATTAN